MSHRLVRDIAAGVAAGYLGSRVMDRATTWYWHRMSAQSQQQEHDANPDGTPLTVGRAVARRIGRGDSAPEAYRTAAQLHRGLGIAYGVGAQQLVRRGVHPAAAGLATGAAAFVLVDEALMSLLLPPPPAYPMESHVRGVVGHLTLGATVSAMLTALRRLTR